MPRRPKTAAPEPAEPNRSTTPVAGPAEPTRSTTAVTGPADPTRSMTAVAWAPGQPCDLTYTSISPPRSDEVLVRIYGVGICHSDLVALEGRLPTPFPAVFGHEGAGIVEAVGSDVRTVAPGDKVVLTFRSCGTCASCNAGTPAYCLRFVPLNLLGKRVDGSCAIHVDGRELTSNFFGQSSFGEFALAYERNVVKVPDRAPLAKLGPLGCSVQTGAGSVMRSLGCERGSSILIVGAGAVGLSAVLGAVVQGCSTIIVSEPKAARRALALELGATHVIDPSDAAVAASTRSVVAEGVDYALDTSGVLAAIAGAAAAVRPRGVLGLLGIPSDISAHVPCNVMALINRGLNIRGIVEGDSDPQTFIPELIDLHLQGRFPFDRFLQMYELENFNAAVRDLKEERCIKAVLRTAAQSEAQETL